MTGDTEVTGADTERRSQASWAVRALGKTGDLALGIVGVIIGALLAFGPFLSSNSSDIVNISAIFVVTILALSIYCALQIWVMHKSLFEVKNSLKMYHEVSQSLVRYKAAASESDRVFRQIQEHRSRLDNYFLEMSQKGFVSDRNAQTEILNYLFDICNYCNKVISIRNGLAAESFNTNIKTVYWDTDSYYYETLVRCANSPNERKNQSKSKFRVLSHAVFDKVLRDPRRRHIIFDLANFLKEKRPNSGNGNYTGPSANALAYYGSSAIVAIFDSSLLHYNASPDVDDGEDMIANSTSIKTDNGDRVHGFLSIDTKAMIFDYQTGDVDVLRELAIAAKSAIKLLKYLKVGNPNSIVVNER